ncbi:MAG TPA: SurA N-terminal domain-containing protein [Caulobacteraceae bacterium]|nr:SurA N-terminal domain-containing protein [Caulobacteraceae bacterium]
MLALIRKFSQSWVASLLLVPLTIGFLIFGVSDVLHPKFSNAVVQAGSHDVSPAAYKRDFQILLQGFEQQTGQEVSVSDAIAAGYDQQILGAVESQAALSDYLSRAGIRPAEYLVDLEINEAPAFANALGQFDQMRVNEFLANNGISAAELKDEIRNDLAQRHMVAGLAAGLRTPKIYGALLASYNLDSRAISYFVLDQHAVPPPPPPTDAQLQALINANVRPRPEMRTLTVVRLSAREIAPNMPVDQAKVQTLYDAAKSSLAQPERRSLIEFATPDGAKAQTIAMRLKAGDSPDVVAKATGVSPTLLADRSKAQIVDPSVADPTFAATAGQVLGPLKSGLAGYAVVKVLKVTPAVTPSLEQLRPQLEAKAKMDEAVARVFAEVQKYRTAADSGANLPDAARAAAVAPITLGPLSADGRDMKNQPVAGATPRLLKLAFSLNQGQESDMQEDEGEGEYFAVRVQTVAPPAMPTVAEVRPQAVQFYMAKTTLDRLNALADQLVKAVNKGQSLEAAAASAHAQVKSLPSVTRQALTQGRQMDAQMIAALFAAKKGEVVSGPVGSAVAVIVARVDGMQAAAGPDAARQAQQAADAFNDSLLGDMVEAARVYAVAKVKPQGDLNAARQAIGAAPEEGSHSGAPPKRGPSL